MQSGKTPIETSQSKRSFAGRISQLHHILLTLQVNWIAIKLCQQHPVFVLLIKCQCQHRAAQWQRELFTQDSSKVATRLEGQA